MRTVSEQLGRPKSILRHSLRGTMLDMVTRGKTVEVLAYTAGLFDGEGSICIGRAKPHGAGRTYRYTARADIGSTDFALLDWLKDIYGGHIYVQKLTNPNYKPFKRWGVGSQQAAEFLRLMRPYLRVKRQLADLLIDFVEQGIDGRPHLGQLGRAYRVHPEELARRHDVWLKMRALNGHPQRLSEMASRTDEATV